MMNSEKIIFDPDVVEYQSMEEFICNNKKVKLTKYPLKWLVDKADVGITFESKTIDQYGNLNIRMYIENNSNRNINIRIKSVDFVKGTSNWERIIKQYRENYITFKSKFTDEQLKYFDKFKGMIIDMEIGINGAVDNYEELLDKSIEDPDLPVSKEEIKELYIVRLIIKNN